MASSTIIKSEQVNRAGHKRPDGATLLAVEMLACSQCRMEKKPDPGKMDGVAVDTASPSEVLASSKRNPGMNADVQDDSSRFASLAHVTSRARIQSSTSLQGSSLSNLRTAAIQSQKKRNDKRGRVEWDWKAELFKNQPKVFRKEKFKVELEEQQQEVCASHLPYLENLRKGKYVVAWHTCNVCVRLFSAGNWAHGHQGKRVIQAYQGWEDWLGEGNFYFITNSVQPLALLHDILDIRPSIKATFSVLS